MTLHEYAKTVSKELLEKPTQQNLIKIVNGILQLKVDGKPISQEQINTIVEYMAVELGDYSVIREQYDNSATLSLIDQVREMIEKAKRNSKPEETK